MPRSRSRPIIVRYLIFLPPVVSLIAASLSTYIPTGDHRSGTWRDPRQYLTIFGLDYFAGLLILLLVRRLIRERKSVMHRNRLSKGQCAACGYDIRATPQRCSECGMSLNEVKA